MQQKTFVQLFKTAKFWVVLVGLAIVIPAAIYIFNTASRQPITVQYMQDYAQVCGADGKPVANAAQYKTGTAPYAVTVMLQSVANDPNQYKNQAVIRGSDAAMQATRERDIQKIQLVACVSRSAETATNQTCEYQNAQLTVYNAAYELTVYEAKTRAQVKSAPIGTDEDYSCTSLALYDAETKRTYMQPVLADIGRELESVVQP